MGRHRRLLACQLLRQGRGNKHWQTQTAGRPMGSFDLRDTIIPFSLLQITNHFRQMDPGEVLEVIGDDKSIAADLKSLLPALEYEFMGIENLGADGADFRLQLRKVKPSPPIKGGTS
jgi:TusA-related sulfurtransferase